jgi:hypothetical protein
MKAQNKFKKSGTHYLKTKTKAYKIRLFVYQTTCR